MNTTKATLSKKTANKADKCVTKKITFSFFAPLSLVVQVAGTFNNWDQNLGVLRKDAKGTWSGAFELRPGRYEYRFLIDGNWENDQNHFEIVPNAFGTFNNVLEVT
ncbi:MAG: isoamylase early set domain-containing protein [Candidatus Omnitrophica bacterium]|nr:isoamylase early set domain-containing protein [Candidatus Omnitrophota bacterium]